MFRDKVVLITGGTGSWGRKLTEQLLARGPRELRIMSRGEFAQVSMQREFNDPRLSFVIGDIRDFNAVEWACRGVDYIFHLAALKHVPICEEQPHEAIKTNVIGTKNLIDAAIKLRVRKVIDVSTDKAVDPLNLYGMSKAIAEKLIVQANKLPGATRFVCIRGGNVLGTNGSVVPYFIDQIRRFNQVWLTDNRMTRFFLTIDRAVSLLFKAADKSYGGETFVLRMPACRMRDIAEVLAERYGDRKTRIVETGRRPGEKLHEVLVSRYEAEQTYTYDDQHYLIMPTLEIEGLRARYRRKGLKRAGFEEYSSATGLLDKAGVRDMLERGGFLG